MPTITEYYKFKQTIPDIPTNAELYAFEYRGWIVARENTDHVLWEILNLDRSKPVVPLRGAFTTKGKAQQAIDGFLSMEARNQAASEQ